MRKFVFRKSCLISIRNVKHQSSYSVLTKPPLASLTIQLNMIQPNMLRLIGTSSKKDLTMGAYAFYIFFRTNRLMMFSPRGFAEETSTFVLSSWTSLIFTSQLEGVLELVGLTYREICPKYFSFFISLYHSIYSLLWYIL